MNCKRCGEDIDKHEVGRDTDACVAEVVMGYYKVHFDEDDNELLYKSVPTRHQYHFVQHFSADIAAAWKVREKLGEKGYSLRIDVDCDGDACECAFIREIPRTAGAGWEVHETEEICKPPLAICLAALKAKSA